MIIEQGDLKEIALLPFRINLAIARGIGRLVVETFDGIVGHIDEPRKDL